MSISPTHDVQAQRQRSAEEWVHGFSAGWREPGGPHEFVDHFTPLLDPEIRLIQPQMATLVGLEAFRRRFAEPLFDLIPDIHGEVRGWAADGDTIWIELELRGTFGGRPLTLETVDGSRSATGARSSAAPSVTRPRCSSRPPPAPAPGRGSPASWRFRPVS